MRPAKSQWIPSSREMSSFENVRRGSGTNQTRLRPPLTYPNYPTRLLITFCGLITTDKALIPHNGNPHFIIDLRGPRRSSSRTAIYCFEPSENRFANGKTHFAEFLQLGVFTIAIITQPSVQNGEKNHEKVEGSCETSNNNANYFFCTDGCWGMSALSRVGQVRGQALGGCTA